MNIIELAKQAGFNPVSYMGSNLELFKRFAELVRADVLAEQPAPAQEPVARQWIGLNPSDVQAIWREWDLCVGDGEGLKSLVRITENKLREKNAPPAPAQPLTDAEIQKLAHVYDNTAPWTLMGFARAIEAAHGITKGGA